MFQLGFEQHVVCLLSWSAKQDKNSAEVDIAPAFGEITTACNVGQGHRVKMPASRVCQGQILCKVSSSQLQSI